MTSRARAHVDHGSTDVVLFPPSVEVIEQTVALADFTDGGGTSGHVDLDEQMPEGAIPLGYKADITEAFSGDGASTIDVGTSGDADRFGAQAAANAVAKVGGVAPADAAAGIGGAQTIRVTVTGAMDFSSISAGEATVSVYYLKTES